jgi:two-component system phosphate regulon sensor histidine kinase PhoR
MTGLPTTNIQGRSFLEITRNDPLSDYVSDLLTGAARGHLDPELLESREIKFYGPVGESIFSVQASWIHEEDSENLILLVFHDVTRAKRVEQIRRDFVANVSHELRTPLTALKGSTEVLLDGAYRNPEECRKFLQIMDKQLSSVQNLVSDMLKLASVEDTRMPVRREIVELQSLLAEIVATVEPLAVKKRQTVTLDVPGDPIYLNADPAQIQDAVMNLLDNAVKYTDESGKVGLQVRIERDGELTIAVSDNGPGIPQDQIPRIFERFYRLDKSRSREMGGTGLGLSIAKHAVENHGGSIAVQSEPGRGSTFTITLPQTALTTEAQSH